MTSRGRGFMKKVLAIIVLFSSSVLISACGNQSHEGQLITKAPASQNEVNDSLIVMGISDTEHSNLLDENPQALSRKLAHNTYDIRGVSKQSVMENAPEALVEKNYFIKPAMTPLGKEEILNEALKFDAAQDFAPENCYRDSLLRVPNIVVSTEKAEVGKMLKLESVKTKNTGLTAWYILPPLGSKINIQYDSSESLELTPDMPGTYAIALFHKQKGTCNLKVSQMTVTLNEAYNPVLSSKEEAQLKSLSTKSFLQITATKTDLAQELITGDEEVILAVLDSGVNYNHPTLKQKMWINNGEIPNDGIDNDGNGYTDDLVGYDFENDDSMPMDDAGHGTHVAGLAAGRYIGTGGVSNVKIMALKAGSSKGVDFGSLIKGTNYAVDNGAHIINMSLGGTRSSDIMKLTLSKANDNNVLIIAAAGNGDHAGKGVNNDFIPQYPASYAFSNIISVGAVKADGSLTRYSNYGRRQVDITAVGGHSDGFEQRANLLTSAYLKNPSNLLTQPMAGTSMAAPVVAGISALALTENPSLTPEEVKTTLMETGEKSPFLRGQISSEAIIDAHAAVQSLQMLF